MRVLAIDQALPPWIRNSVGPRASGWTRLAAWEVRTRPIEDQAIAVQAVKLPRRDVDGDTGAIRDGLGSRLDLGLLIVLDSGDGR